MLQKMLIMCKGTSINFKKSVLARAVWNFLKIILLNDKKCSSLSLTVPRLEKATSVGCLGRVTGSWNDRQINQQSIFSFISKQT